MLLGSCESHGYNVMFSLVSHNLRQLTLRIPFSWDVMLCKDVIRLWCFEAMQSPYLKGLKCPFWLLEVRALLLWNAGIWLASDIVTYPRKTELSATLLQKFKTHNTTYVYNQRMFLICVIPHNMERAIWYPLCNYGEKTPVKILTLDSQIYQISHW
jgi:hypothetical protein